MRLNKWTKTRIITTFQSGGGGTDLTSCDNSFPGNCEGQSNIAIAKSLKFTGHPEVTAEGLQKKNLTAESQHVIKRFDTIPAVNYNANVMNYKSKNTAFTLAEVLITLAIIGIVAAMTIPTLVQNYQEKQTVAKLRSTYSILNEAVKLMIVENGNLNRWGVTGQAKRDLFINKFEKYIQVVKRCAPRRAYSDGCVGRAYGNIFNDETNEYVYAQTDLDTFVLKNGATAIIQMNGDENCFQDITLNVKNPNNNQYQGNYAGSCGKIIIDLNGAAGPNKFNVDTFNFFLEIDGLLPAGSRNERIWTEKFEDSCLNRNGEASTVESKCTAWVIYNGNMDYLHCPEKLGWDKASSCKD